LASRTRDRGFGAKQAVPFWNDDAVIGDCARKDHGDWRMMRPAVPWRGSVSRESAALSGWTTDRATLRTQMALLLASAGIACVGWLIGAPEAFLT
jgi:hypothetical protein